MIFDSHAHYDDHAYDGDREEILPALARDGVGTVVNVGASLEGTRRTVELIRKYPFMYGAAGVHPDEVGELNEETFAWLREQCLQKKIITGIKRVMRFRKSGLSDSLNWRRNCPFR